MNGVSPRYRKRCNITIFIITVLCNPWGGQMKDQLHFGTCTAHLATSMELKSCSTSRRLLKFPLLTAYMWCKCSPVTFPSDFYWLLLLNIDNSTVLLLVFTKLLISRLWIFATLFTTALSTLFHQRLITIRENEVTSRHVSNNNIFHHGML